MTTFLGFTTGFFGGILMGAVASASLQMAKEKERSENANRIIEEILKQKEQGEQD